MTTETTKKDMTDEEFTDKLVKAIKERGPCLTRTAVAKLGLLLHPTTGATCAMPNMLWLSHKVVMDRANKLLQAAQKKLLVKRHGSQMWAVV